METHYGRNPKRITCGCNAEESTQEVITISLNDRCPVCSQLRQICIPKKAIKVKQVPQLASASLQVA